MSKVTKVSGFVIVAAFAAALAYDAAAAPHERFPISLEEVEARIAARFEASDTDGDGAISLAEFETADIAAERRGIHGKRGMRLGKDRAHGRQELSEEERAERRERMAERREQMKERRQEMRARRDEHEARVNAELFSILDADGDGVVTDSEHAAGSTRENRVLAGKRVMFARLDRDESGYLTTDEFPSPLARLRDADADGDGVITRDEMRGARGHMLRHRAKPDA